MIPTQLNFFLDPLCCQQRTDPKEYFFSIVAASLLKETKYYELSSQSRDKLIETMKNIAELDPEFILQVAYYVRNQMYIRSVSNFILAFATIHPKTKPFCSIYMCPTILIPGDLIEVCQFTQVIKLCLEQKENQKLMTNEYPIRKHLNFPKILQKQIQKKIKQFTLYQLGKQCSESSRKKNLKQYQECLQKDLKQKRRLNRLKKLMKIRNEAMKQGDDVKKQFTIKEEQMLEKKNRNQAKHQKSKRTPVEITNVFDCNFLSLKDIITFSHAKEPRSLIMSIYGAKYPETEELFQKEFQAEPNLKFDQNLVGKKMKIPIPTTWDRELSKNEQSKQQVWQNLLLNNQVPYLALLRNLRNILQSGASQEAHIKAINKIANPTQVQNSKIFPLQYFTALKEISSLIEPQNEQKVKERREKNTKIQEKQAKQEIEQEQIKVPQDIAKLYTAAIEDAIKIAVDRNLDTISGVTYIFVDVSGSMRSPISGGKKYGSVNQCMDLAFVLSHMIRSKCEQCQFYLFAAPQSTKVPYTKVEFNNDTLLQAIQKCNSEATKLCGSHEMIGQTIDDLLLKPKIKADQIVVLSDMMVTRGFSDSPQRTMKNVISEYLNQVNKDAKFFFMDISGYGNQVSFGDDLQSKSCFVINGMSDNVLKYISYAGKLNQIDDIIAFSQELKAQAQNKMQIEK